MKLEGEGAMGTLYIDRKDLEVRLDGNAIAFYSVSGREGVVPINPYKKSVSNFKEEIARGIVKHKIDAQEQFLNDHLQHISQHLHRCFHHPSDLQKELADHHKIL